MCTMNIDTYELIMKLKRYPTFTLDQVSALTGKDPDYIKVYLNRLKKKGIVFSLEKNRYTVQEDPLVVSTSISWPSYVSVWYALRFHDLTEQLPNTIDVLTPSVKNRSVIEFNGSSIVFTTIPKRYLFGFSKVDVSGFDVFMADPEKAILDSVLLRKISLSEIYDIISSNKDRISSRTMIEHCLRTGNRASMKRIGWILDDLGISGTDELKKRIYRTRIPLDHSLPPEGDIDSVWGVIVNMGEDR